MRILATTLLLSALLLAPAASAGPLLCMALECNPVYKAQQIVYETIGDPFAPTCDAQDCTVWSAFQDVRDLVRIPPLP